MQEKLIIFLTETPTAVLSGSHQLLTPEQFHAAAENREVIVLVPAQDVLLMLATLPPMKRNQLKQALPYALEEQLIDDVSKLHFAAGEYQADGRLPVAIASHEKMQHWLSMLKDWNIVPDKLIPLTLALPYSDQQIYVEKMAITRTGAVSGVCCDTNQIDLMLSLLSAPIQVQNYTGQAVSLSLPSSRGLSTGPSENSLTEYFHPTNQFELDVATNLVFTPLNLLQNEYAIKKNKFPETKKMWRTVFYVGLVWLGLLFVYPFISYLMLHHKLSSLNQEINAIYHRHFPAATTIVAPKMRMEEKLQKLNSSLGASHFLMLMGESGKALQQAPSVRLKRFDYQNNLLTMELSAASPEDVNAFTEFLTQHGLTARQQNANLAGGRINATVVVE